MDSAKKVKWIIPFKKFGMVRVKWCKLGEKACTDQHVIHSFVIFHTVKYSFIHFKTSIIYDYQ